MTGLYEYQVRRYRPEIGRELNIPLQTALLSSLSQSPLHSESALSKSVGSTTEAHSKYATTYFKYSLIFIDNRTCCRGCAGGWAIVPTDIHVKYKVDRSHRLYQQVVEHEKHHMKDAEMKSLVFGEIAAILTGECEREECYQAKQQLIKSAINVEIAQYDFDQARFDCFDELGSVLRCSEMPNLLAKLQMEGATWKRWIEKVERVCAK